MASEGHSNETRNWQEIFARSDSSVAPLTVSTVTSVKKEVSTPLGETEAQTGAQSQQIAKKKHIVVIERIINTEDIPENQERLLSYRDEFTQGIMEDGKQKYPPNTYKVVSN